MLHFVGQMFPHGFPQPLDVQLHCYSSLSAHDGDRIGPDFDNGGKFHLPPSILNQLTRLNITYPMLFHVTNVNTGRDSYCGVLEFIAPEGQCYAPRWMMKNLALPEGGIIRITSASLPVATYAKFEPQSVDFLDITDPKAMLENSLRNFATLTSGDIIGITYNNKLIELRVVETKPQRAVCCIECNVEVDFAPPVGYVDPQRPSEPTNQGSDSNSMEDDGEGSNYTSKNDFIPFTGAGNRLDGKTVIPSPTPAIRAQRGTPDYDWKAGNLTFFRPTPKLVSNTPKKD